jgi:hypothetical protein
VALRPCAAWRGPGPSAGLRCPCLHGAAARAVTARSPCSRDAGQTVTEMRRLDPCAGIAMVLSQASARAPLLCRLCELIRRWRRRCTRPYEGKIKAARCGRVGWRKSRAQSTPRRDVQFYVAMCVFRNRLQGQRSSHIASENPFAIAPTRIIARTLPIRLQRFGEDNRRHEHHLRASQSEAERKFWRGFHFPDFSFSR